MEPSLSFAGLVSIIWGIEGVRPFVLAGVLVAVVVAWWVRARWGRSFVLGAGALVAEAGLLAVTLVPDLGEHSLFSLTPWWWRRVRACAASWDGSISHALHTLDGRANIVLFAVPTVLGGLWLGRPFLVAAGMVAQSAVIELVQGLFGSGCLAGDWVANSVGGAAGLAAALAAAVVVRFGRRLRPAFDAAATGS